MLAVFMAAVEATIVATAMPTIVSELGGFHLFSWVFAAYLLAQAVSTPVYGRLADLYGRRRMFVIGATIFLLGSTACGFTWLLNGWAVNRSLAGEWRRLSCSAWFKDWAQAQSNRWQRRSSATSTRRPSARVSRAGFPAFGG